MTETKKKRIPTYAGMTGFSVFVCKNAGEKCSLHFAWYCYN